LIHAGRVKLNGALRRDSETPVDVGKDWIEIDGKPLAGSEKVYLALHKPRGVVTTASDEKGRETVYAYLPAGVPWVAPVGRLDKASEGLLLLTNDSEWAARISAPETHLDKIYHVQIGAIADETLLDAAPGDFLRHGVEMHRGRMSGVSQNAVCLRLRAPGAKNRSQHPNQDEAVRSLLENSSSDYLVTRHRRISPVCSF
jgi:23S rRNA pseudouridine2605 synthase